MILGIINLDVLILFLYNIGMGQKQTKIIIITPHSYCVDLPYRHGDMRATEEALKLMMLLENKGLSFDYFKADRFRHHIDYNRACSRTYKLRRDIDKRIKYYKGIGHDVIVLEIHSFPLGYDAYDIKDKPIAFLATPHYTEDTKKVVSELNKKLNFPVLEFVGVKTHDIQHSTAKYDLKHYLIEFHEKKDKLTEEQSVHFHAALVDILFLEKN